MRLFAVFLFGWIGNGGRQKILQYFSDIVYLIANELPCGWKLAVIGECRIRPHQESFGASPMVIVGFLIIIDRQLSYYYRSFAAL